MDTFKEEEVETLSGPSHGSHCTFTQDVGTPPEGPVDIGDLILCTENEEGGLVTENAELGVVLGQPALLYETTTAQGGPPPDMCICENDFDLNHTAVEIEANIPRVAKIRKFDEPSDPLGGSVTIFVNNAAYTFTTDPGYSIQTLNQRMVGALVGVTVMDLGDYLMLSKVGSKTPITQIGFHSQDAGIPRSEISLEPANFTDGLTCAQGTGHTLCGAGLDPGI